MTRLASIATLIFVPFCLFAAAIYHTAHKAPPRWEIIMYGGNGIEVFVDYGDSLELSKEYQKLHPNWMIIEKQ